MSVDISDLLPVLEPEIELSPSDARRISRLKKYKHAVTMAVLFLINLLNFMDRFAIAGVLEKIQDDFDISNAQAGLLQTVFVCSYMALAPLFGYLGDRYSRKWMIIVGVTLWSLTTLAGSFVPKNLFIVFILLRCFVGVGEASYSCVAPTIIADMYKNDRRTTMLAVFNTATPLGGGLGYIVGAYVSKAFNSWRWALRVTPILGAVCVLLLLFLVEEPARGGADGAHVSQNTSWFRDVRQIFKVKSFVCTTLGFTWVAFALGSLAWWGPIFLQKAYILCCGKDDEETKANVNLYFGAITCVAGLLGVLLGTEIAKRYRRRNDRGDPIVCGVAVLIAVPFLFIVLIYSKDHVILTWIFIFITETLLCSNWAVISDILMYIIVPARRATASSIQIFVMHLLGDASSPYIVGETSDFFQKGSNETLVEWKSLRNGLMLTPSVAILGGFAFLLAAIFIVQDRREAHIAMKALDESNHFGLADAPKVSKGKENDIFFPN